jgi:hypothetical protein
LHRCINTITTYLSAVCFDHNSISTEVDNSLSNLFGSTARSRIVDGNLASGSAESKSDRTTDTARSTGNDSDTRLNYKRENKENIN